MSQITLNQAELAAERAELADFLAQPNAYSSPDFSAKNKRFTELETLLGVAAKRDKLRTTIAGAKELIAAGGELAELAKDELAEAEAELAALEDELFIMLTPKDPNDGKNLIMEIRAGAGGDEASLFAAELYRMYLRYCETHGFKTELMSESPNDAGGYKEVVFRIAGDSPYGVLKFESGVHRVQRVPATESQGRVHTSTVTVAVLPAAEETQTILRWMSSVVAAMVAKASTPPIAPCVLLTYQPAWWLLTKTKNPRLRIKKRP